MASTSLSGPLFVGGVPTMGMGGFPPFTGTYYFVDAVNGSNGNSGTEASPLATVYSAFSRCVSGNNDVVVIVGDGSTTGTQRLSLANAQAVDSAATAGTLVWNKNATHLIGMTAPTVAARARFAPPTGTYTMATFGSGNFVTVSGSGCYFANFSLFNGFSTGGASQICWTDTGGRNYYEGISFGGAGDAASAQATTSRSLLLSGTTGEHTFVNCEIGLDTVTKTVANASLEFAGGIPRNSFYNCVFPMITSSATTLSVLITGASAIDRFQMFKNCWFLNAMSSGATAQTAIVSMTNASPGGYLVMDNCAFVGNTSTNWGDANAMANMYINGASPTAATNGISINPT